MGIYSSIGATSGGGSSATSFLLDDGNSAVPSAGVIAVTNGTGATTQIGAANQIKIVVTGGGKFFLNYTPTAISYVVLVTDAIIGVTSTAAPRTITMPNAGMTAGQLWIIKDESLAAGVNNITISGNGSLIDGLASQSISSSGGSMQIYWNGTNFFIT